MPEILAALIADTLETQGFETFDNALDAWLKVAHLDREKLHHVLAPFQVSYRLEEVENRNWNAQWESNFKAVRLLPDVGIRAHFHPPFENCRYQVEITPKMSFGTGHHATTQLVVEYLYEAGLQGKRVLDFGSGTGVLGIFAAMKGADEVLGTDNDPNAIENARENAARNHCKNVNFSTESLKELTGYYDVIVANINRNILLEHAAEIFRLSQSGGSLFLSGLLQADHEDISRLYTEIGFTELACSERQGWIALHFVKPAAVAYL